MSKQTKGAPAPKPEANAKKALVDKTKAQTTGSIIKK